MSEERSPIDMALDLLVYAPLGATIEMWERVPELAKVGRDRLAAQSPAARMVGQFAVTTGRTKVEGALGDLTSRGVRALQDLGVLDRSDEATDPSPDQDTDNGNSDDAAVPASVPIDGYDDMTAAAVVPLLAALDAAGRAVVRDHEEANRGRRTILAKIDQLEASSDAGAA